MPRSRRPTRKIVENDAATQATQARARRGVTSPAPLSRQSQIPTESLSPDPALEGSETQQQQVGPLTMLAQAAESHQLQVRDSQRPGQAQELFNDADSFLREFSSISDVEDAPPPIIRETVPPLALRPSPKANRFTDVAREIVDAAAPTIEDISDEERPEVHFIAAGWVGKDKTPCFSKLFPSIWDFHLYLWEKDVVTTAERKWSAKGFVIEKESLIARISAKNIKPSTLTVCERADWQAAIREVDKLNSKGASAIRVELRLQLEALERPDEKDELTSSDSDSELNFLSSRKRAKATPASSKKTGNSKIEKQLALERVHRLIDKAELNHVAKLIELHECLAGGCRNNSLPCVKVGEEHIKLNHEQVGAWSRAINKGKATLERPHARLYQWAEGRAAEQIKAREAKSTGKKKKQRKDRSDDESSTSSTRKRRRRRRSYSTGRPIIVNVPPQQYYPGYPPPAVEKRASRPASSAGPAPQSSPIRTAVNSKVLIERYIDYLKNEKHEKSQKYDEAMRLMLNEDIEVPHLLRNRGGVTRAQLQGLGMTMGIAIDVKEGVRTFRILHRNLFEDSHEARDGSQSSSPSRD